MHDVQRMQPMNRIQEAYFKFLHFLFRVFQFHHGPGNHDFGQGAPFLHIQPLENKKTGILKFHHMFHQGWSNARRAGYQAHFRQTIEGFNLILQQFPSRDVDGFNDDLFF